MATAERGRIVVVGASAGGVEALQHLVAALPADLVAPVLVVLHVPPTGSVLPQILARAGTLEVHHARDGERLDGRHVYVAPPDYHLRVRDGHVTLVRGPRENGHRPSVDSLFRTAARAYGGATVGVVLSGTRDDGTLGLAAIKQVGGTTIVQDPAEAVYPGMPTSAIERVGPDHVMRVAEIAELVAALVGNGGGGSDRTRNEDEGGAMEGDAQHEIEPAGNPSGVVSGYTCPECNGTLWEVGEGSLVKLECRVGHSYTEEAYAAEKAQALEAALWTALQTLEERADFADRLARRFAADEHSFSATRYAEQRANLLEQAAHVRDALASLDLVDVDPGERRAS